MGNDVIIEILMRLDCFRFLLFFDFIYIRKIEIRSNGDP